MKPASIRSLDMPSATLSFLFCLHLHPVFRYHFLWKFSVISYVHPMYYPTCPWHPVLPLASPLLCDCISSPLLHGWWGQRLLWLAFSLLYPQVLFMIDAMNLLNESIIQLIASEIYVSETSLKDCNSQRPPIPGLIHCEETSGRNSDRSKAINHAFLPGLL